MAAPLLIAAALWVGDKIGGAVCELLIEHGADYLSATEVERVSQALSSAITEVAPPATGLQRLNPLSKRSVKKQLTREFEGQAIMELGAPSGTRAPHDWRVPLEQALKQAAIEGLQDADTRERWEAIILPAEADEADEQRARRWARKVRGIFELKLADDKKARVLLARLDWGSEQATRIAVAEALEDMRVSMRKIAVAMTGIAGSVAVVVEILAHIEF